MKRTEDQYRIGLRSSVLADNQGFMKLSSVVSHNVFFYSACINPSFAANVSELTTNI